MKVLILCAFWLQEPPKEVVQIIEKMCGDLQDPMEEVWEHRLPIKLSRQCLWCIQITRNSFDFLWMHSWWHNHWWFLIGMLRSFEEPQGSKQKMSGLHTEVQEEVAWHQRLWGCQLVVKLITCLNSVLSIDWASCFDFLFHVPLMLLHSCSSCSAWLIQVIRHTKFPGVIFDILSRPGMIVRFLVCIWLVLAYHCSVLVMWCLQLCHLNALEQLTILMWKTEKQFHPVKVSTFAHLILVSSDLFFQADVFMGLAQNLGNGWRHHQDPPDGRRRGGLVLRPLINVPCGG